MISIAKRSKVDGFRYVKIFHKIAILSIGDKYGSSLRFNQIL